MGNACCVAPRDKMVLLPNSSSATAERRHSPTWSFRWDNNHNRGRVAGEEASLSWLSDGISRNDVLSDFKSDFLSSQGSPLDSFRTQTLQKSPASGKNKFSLFSCFLSLREHMYGVYSLGTFR